jgi:branched-subunit amino acid transport protein
LDPSYLSALIAVILSRSAERVLLVLAGALAVYLGYRLFLAIPAADKSEGRINLPGGVSIFLTRIGPGVFFALFGCALIGYSVRQPIDFSIPVGVAAARSASTEAGPAQIVHYSGFGQGMPAGGLDPAVVVARLNGYLDDMRQRLDRPAAEELAAAIRAAKLAVMERGWKPEWGERETFARWVSTGADGDPPAERAAGAVVVFQTKLR